MLNGDTEALIVWSTVFTFLGTLFGTARLSVRGWIVKSLRLDDVFLLLAITTGIAAWITILIYANRILSHWTTSTGEIYDSPLRFEAELFNQAFINVFTLQNTLARVSLVLSYRRFTPETVRGRWAHIVMRCLLVLTVGVCFVTMVLSTVPCWPPHLLGRDAAFYQEIIDGRYKCLEPRVVFFWNGVAMAPLDLIIWIFPFVLLRGVRLSKKQKICLYILFAFGGAVFIVSIFRILFLFDFWDDTVLSEGVSPLTDVSNIWVFTAVEANSILIAASVPTFRPLFRRIRDRVKQRTESSLNEVSLFTIGKASRKSGAAIPDVQPFELDLQRRDEDV